jgi:UDP-N-acetylmuramate--alanine ligase
VKIHFVGIGGIGLSGLARVLKSLGHEVEGSDLKQTKLTQSLMDIGIKVSTPQSASNISNQDLVVYSAVVKEDNVERQEAQKQGIKTISRKELLPMILDKKKVYSVAGAHGKSTTSAILTAIMQCDAIIGAESKEFDCNVRFNNDKLIAFEADESDASFLNSNPYCAIVTNAEPEHMEYYKHDISAFENAYRNFLDLATLRVINAEDPLLASFKLDAIKLYPSVDITDIRYDMENGEPLTIFNLKKLGEFKVWGYGTHMAIDASLAILAALNELDITTIRRNLRKFKGIKKRFDILHTSKESTLIDDYAHHPTEIKATLESAKLYARLKQQSHITAIWQPHKYSRTIANLNGFETCFKGVDELIILPVYSAGEEQIKIDFEHLFKAYHPKMAKNIKEARKISDFDNGVVIGFGAGDITYQLRED